MVDILYVIVLYKCRLDETLTYRTLICEDSDKYLFVYDNSPYLQDFERANMFYYHDTNNSGIGVAYNMAAEFARENGFKWLLFLDQDTTFPSNAEIVYKNAIHDHPDINMFVPRLKILDGRYISPTKYFLKTSYPQKKVKTGYVSFKDAAPINSGIMVSIDSFFMAGGYDPQIILDFSDICFIERYSRMFEGFFVVDIECVQNFSVEEREVNKLLPRYLIFLECAKRCKRNGFEDNFAYFFVTLKRTMKLTLQTRRMCFLKFYYQKYLKTL